MWGTLIAVIGTLGGAALVGGLGLWGQQLQWHRERQVAATDSLVSGVEELIVRAETLDVASHQAVAMVGSFVSLGGQVNRLFGVVTPLDLPGVMAPMHAQYEALTRAAASIRLTQNATMVQLADDVMQCATKVIEAHHAALPRSPLMRGIQTLLRRPSTNDRRVADARASLGEATRALVDEVQLRGSTTRR